MDCTGPSKSCTAWWGLPQLVRRFVGEGDPIHGRASEHGRTSMSGAPIRTVRGFLVLQVVIFLAAASMHFGLLLSGYVHHAAGTAESVIAIVLLAGLALTWAPPPWNGRAAASGQAFGIFGTLVGLVTIAIGVGPRTDVDVAIHGLMLVVLTSGLVVTARAAWSRQDLSGV